MNRLFFGNNLPVMSLNIEANSVDLVYLDPPFNSKAKYNVLYETPTNQRETAQRSVFNDSWHWEDDAQACFDFAIAHGGPSAAILNSLRSALGRSDTMAYLAMMSARLLEIRRVLKPTGSLYLHCDPTASHYLKIIMDAIFGPKNFRNEVIWKRTNAHGRAKKWGPIHDVMLFYTMSDGYTWNRVFQDYDQSYLESHYKYTDGNGRYRLVTLDGPGKRTGSSGQPWRGVDPTAKGRHWELPPDRALPAWFVHPPGYSAMSVQDRLDILDDAGILYWPPRGTLPQYKRYLSVSAGNPIQDVITDIDAVNSQAEERIGFPTQKPVRLLERIISASSNEGDVVLDPFCGCGTTIDAATQLKRTWIGIDVSYYGIRLIERRVRKKFPACQLTVSGIPADLVSAEALAESAPYGFQQWAVDELGCQMWNDGKKGADGGIDGEMWFMAGPGAPGRLLVQVKGGKKTTVAHVREFRHVLDSQNAQMGVFVSRANSTAEMRSVAAEAGQYRIGGALFPRLQLVSMDTWFSGHRPKLPVPIPLAVPQDKSRGRIKAPKRPDPRQPEFAFVFHGKSVGPNEGQIINPSFLPDSTLTSGIS